MKNIDSCSHRPADGGVKILFKLPYVSCSFLICGHFTHYLHKSIIILDNNNNIWYENIKGEKSDIRKRERGGKGV